MTDKATVEMESPVSGKVLEIAGEVGDQIPIGSVLIVFETEGGGAGAAAESEEPIADGMAEIPDALDDTVPSTDVETVDRRSAGERRGADEDRRSEARGAGGADRRVGEWRADRPASDEDRRGEDRRAGEDRRGPGRDGSDRRQGDRRDEGGADGKAVQAPRALCSPAVRRRARDLGIDLSQVQYSGDRIRHSDLDAFLLYSG